MYDGTEVVPPVVVVLVCLGAYLRAAIRLRRRGDAWPWRRDAAFGIGCAALTGAALVPLPLGEFTGHMVRHLITGMAAPLLLVLGRPLTLTFRTLPPRTPRHVILTLAHSRPSHWLVFPPVAALLDAGGLWVLYRTRLFAATHDHPLLHALVHVHVMVTGLLFSAAVCQVDPLRRRYGPVLRATTLITAAAAHAVLAKSVWASPPPGTSFSAGDLHTGAITMYYGGDLVELSLAATLAAQWYAAAGRLLRRSTAPRRDYHQRDRWATESGGTDDVVDRPHLDHK